MDLLGTSSEYKKKPLKSGEILKDCFPKSRFFVVCEKMPPRSWSSLIFFDGLIIDCSLVRLKFDFNLQKLNHTNLANYWIVLKLEATINLNTVSPISTTLDIVI